MKISDCLLPDFQREVIEQHGAKAIEVLSENVHPDMQLSKLELMANHAFQCYTLPLYVLCRIMRPGTVVETGVQNGGSAQAILYALHKNDNGFLYSFDSNETSSDGTHLYTQGFPGQYISEYLKSRWQLTIGLTQNMLMPVLAGIPTVDLFFHDSDHSKAVVEFEFASVRERASSGALLCMHDDFGQWEPEKVMPGYPKIFGSEHPQVIQIDGVFHYVLRGWRVP